MQWPVFQCIDIGYRLLHRIGIFGFVSLIRHIETFKKQMQITLRHRIAVIVSRIFGHIEYAGAVFGTQKHPIQADLLLLDQLSQGLLAVGVDRRRTIRNQQ